MRSLVVVALSATLVAAAGAAGAFELSSPDFPAGGKLPDSAVLAGFGCTGGNRLPALRWRDPPPGTRSFALSLYDQDAPTGSGFWHWMAIDVPPDLRRIDAGPILPEGAAMARNDYGAQGYGGVCPPEGDPPHRYVFKITALDVAALQAPLDTSAALVGFLIHQHAIATTSVTATYGRE